MSGTTSPASLSLYEIVKSMLLSGYGYGTMSLTSPTTVSYSKGKFVSGTMSPASLSVNVIVKSMLLSCYGYGIMSLASPASVSI